MSAYLIRTLIAAMVLVGLGFAALYCRQVGPYWKLTPDSTSYVFGAESLAEGQGYRDEHGSPVSLFAPGTSAILAPAWIAGRKSYLAMNAEVVLFAFAALAIAFLLFRESLGAVGSGVVVLLCLGSSEYFNFSTFLLSEIFYIFLSLLAFWWYRRGNTAGTIFSSLAGLMVRTVGVCLPVAFAIDTLLLDPFRKGRKRWMYAAAYAMPLLFSLGWEVRNRLLGWSYSELMMENEPWNRASGHIAVSRLLARPWDNLAYGRDIENLLTNQWTRDANWAIWPGIALAVLIALGFRRLSLNRESSEGKMIQGHSAVGIYCILYLFAVALSFPEVVARYMVPLLPFLSAYLVAGVQSVAEFGGRWLYVPAASLLALYLTAGYHNDLQIVADDLARRIPGQLVVYPGGEDIHRLALWWKEHAGENEIYACQHPNVINVITGRHGVHYGNTTQPDGLERSLEAKHARFLLLTMNSSRDRAAARVAESDAHFHLVREQGEARLYELGRQ